MEIGTGVLIKNLKNAKDIKIFLQENQSSITDPTLREYLEKLLLLKGLKRQDGIKTKPGRNQTLSLAFGFGLNNEETARLLKIAGVGALYPKNKRDSIIIHALETGKSITQANEILSSLDLGTLSDQKK